VPPTATPPGPITRPAANGLHPAERMAPITVDGQFDEWPGDWQPIDEIVFGNSEWSGPGDLSGEFQVGWALNGLYLALRATDDVYAGAPPGDQMYRGDSVELVFDRELAADFNVVQGNQDDYQLGLGEELGGIGFNAYRWLPVGREGAVIVQGAIVLTTDGYALEAIVPWSVFDVQSSELTGQETFGFSVSLSDNDDPAPAQQSMVSSSSQRVNLNRPPQWGTLMLQP
jgi:hypothetical protein